MAKKMSKTNPPAPSPTLGDNDTPPPMPTAEASMPTDVEEVDESVKEIGSVANDIITQMENRKGDEVEPEDEIEDIYEEEEGEDGQEAEEPEMFILVCASNNTIWISTRDQLWEYTKDFKQLEGFDEDAFSIYRVGQQVKIKAYTVELEDC